MELTRDNLDTEFMTSKSKMEHNENKILKFTNIINMYLKTIRGKH